MDQYGKDHEVCPKCGSDHYSTTLMGYCLDMNNKEAYKDLNQIECQNCGYICTAHDLVPKISKK